MYSQWKCHGMHSFAMEFNPLFDVFFAFHRAWHCQIMDGCRRQCRQRRLGGSGESERVNAPGMIDNALASAKCPRSRMHVPCGCEHLSLLISSYTSCHLRWTTSRKMPCVCASCSQSHVPLTLTLSRSSLFADTTTTPCPATTITLYPTTSITE
jgi:hypothetical protein